MELHLEKPCKNFFLSNDKLRYFSTKMSYCKQAKFEDFFLEGVPCLTISNESYQRTVIDT